MRVSLAVFAERERGGQRHGILIDDERELDDAALVAFRQSGRKRHGHQRRVLGARGRLEGDEALVLYDRRIVEEQVHEVGPGVRILVGLSESASACRAKEREAREGLPSAEVLRHRSASIPSAGVYWSHSNSE